MRRMHTTALTSALFLMTAASGAAQDRPLTPIELSTARYIDHAKGMSMEQAVSMGLEREPALQGARTSVDAARGTRHQATLRPNPQISVMRQEQVGGPDATTSVDVQWPLDLYRRDGRIAVADRALEAARFSVADHQRLLAADIRAAYGEVLAAVRNLEIATELVDVNRRGYDLLRARVERGASPPIERNIADVELRRIESQQWLQAARADAALIELKRLLGLEPGADLKLRDTLETVVESVAPTVPANISPLVAERSDVREAAVKVRLADARIDVARREGRFDLGVYGGFTRMGFSFPQLGLNASGGSRSEERRVGKECRL